MTAVEMQYDFDSKIRSHKKLSGLNIASSDIQRFLNNAQEELIRKHSALFNDETESVKYLTPLVRTIVRNSTQAFSDSTNVEGGLYIKLPDDVKYTLMERITQTSNFIIYQARIKDITMAFYNLNYLNPYKNPYKDEIWRLVYGLDSTSTTSIVHQLILAVGFIFNYYKLTYITYPSVIDINTNTTCQLDKTIHPELVNLAVELAVESYSKSNTMDEKKN